VTVAQREGTPCLMGPCQGTVPPVQLLTRGECIALSPIIFKASGAMSDPIGGQCQKRTEDSTGCLEDARATDDERGL
jgi:hypothetical protein